MSVQPHVDGASHDQPVTIPIDNLLHADSPRLDGEDTDHIRVLAEVGQDLPPILVHRETMRVIDGMHRLRAAKLNGRRHIAVRFFEGPAAGAFVAAVRANISHGLPLSRADREAAAERILASHPGWSDRAIGEAVGLAPTTVARIRGRRADRDGQPQARIGRDGRVRPINGAAGRRLAGRLFAEHPDASLREVAEQADISPATARDVRERLRRGEDPVPPKLVLAERRKQAAGRGDRSRAPAAGPRRRHSAPDIELILRKLQRDPSLRLTQDGRLLLRWLSTHALKADEWEGIGAEIPAHCVPLVADLARDLAEQWGRIAESLTRRARTEMA